MITNYDSICCFRNKCGGSKKLLWELNTACNLNCSFCHRTEFTNKGPSLEEIVNLLPLLKDFGIENIILSGGEPLLKKDIFKILDYIKNFGFGVDMCTNATLITSSVAKELSNYLSEISLSIDSYDFEKHDMLRNKAGALKMTVKGVEYLLQENIEIHSISLVTSENIDEIDQTINFIQNLGISSLSFIGKIPLGNIYNSLEEDETQTKLRLLFKTLREKYFSLNINTKELFLSPEMNICSSGINVYGLDVNLMFKPCILYQCVEGINLRDKKNRDIYLLNNKINSIRELAEQQHKGKTNCLGRGILMYNGN